MKRGSNIYFGPIRGSSWNLWQTKCTCCLSILIQKNLNLLICFIGFLLGSLYLGWLADKIGRKRNLMFTLVGMLVCNLVSASTYQFSVYILSRFLVGIFLAGNILSAVTLLTELVGPSYRGVYCMGLMGSFSLGIVCLSMLASYWRDSWRLFTFSVSVIGLPFLSLEWYMVESPR